VPYPSYSYSSAFSRVIAATPMVVMTIVFPWVWDVKCHVYVSAPSSITYIPLGILGRSRDSEMNLLRWDHALKPPVSRLGEINSIARWSFFGVPTKIMVSPSARA